MFKFLQKYFLTGMLAITPLAITVWILWRFYDLISDNMRPLLHKIPALRDAYPEFFLTVIGVVVFILLITLIGMTGPPAMGGTSTSLRSPMTPGSSFRLTSLRSMSPRQVPGCCGLSRCF